MRKQQKAITKLLHNFFVAANSVNNQIQLLFILLEFIVYLAIINGGGQDLIIPPGSDGVTFFLIVIVLLMLRAILQVHLISVVGLVILQGLSKQYNSFSIINAIVLVVIYASEILNAIAFDFSTNNLQSESNNLNKLYFRLNYSLNVILFSALKDTAFLHLYACIAFLLLFLYIERSLVRSERFRQLRLRCLIGASLQHLRLFFTSFGLPNTLSVILLFAVCSQLIYFLYNRKQRPSLNELLANGMYLELGFYVLKDKFDEHYNSQVELFVKSSYSQGQFPFDNTSEHIFKNLRPAQNFFEGIMSVDMHIVKGHLIKAQQEIEVLKDRVKWYSFSQRIIVYRIKQYIAYRFEESDTSTIPYEEEYKSFLSFQELLYKAAMQNLRFNLSLKKLEVDCLAMKNICLKIIAYEEQIEEKYEQTKDCFTESTKLYVDYLFQVKNDVQRAQEIINTQMLKIRMLVDFNIDHKIYLKVRPQQQHLVIEKVGYKAKELLDYDRKDLEGQNISRLLPAFYRKRHQQLSNSFVQESIDRMQFAQKKAVALNNRNTYNQCCVTMKLSYCIEQGFRYEGNLCVIPAKNHDLDSYFIISERGSIVEDSINVQNLQKHLKGQQVGEPMSIYAYGTTSAYEPIVTFKDDQSCYLYAKCIARQAINQAIEQQQQKLQQNNKGNDENLQTTLQLINNTSISAILFFLFLAICCLSFSIYLTFYSAQLKYDNQTYTINTQRLVMRYYQSTINLGISMTYVDIRDHYNYTATVMKKLGLINKTLQLQSLNEGLKFFNRGKYKINSVIPGMQSLNSNFDLVGVLYSGTKQYEKFDKDIAKRNAVINSVRDIIGFLLLQSISDYRYSFFEAITPFADQSTFYDQLSVGLLSSFPIVFIILAVVLFRQLENVERQALNLRCGTVFSQNKIEEIKDYLKVITLQAVAFDQINRELNNYNVPNKAETESIFLRSQMSLVKQNTSRKFNSQSHVFEEALANKLQPKQTKIMTKTGSYRWIVVISATIGILLIGLSASKFILSNKLKKINELESATSINYIFRTSYRYSRIIAVSLNTILLKQTRNIDNYEFYNEQAKSLYSFFATYTYPDFPEASFDQFQPFASQFNQLLYTPICTFMVCQSATYAELNTNYLTLIRYLIPNLTQLVNQTATMNETAFSSYILSSQIKHYLDLLFQSERLIRNNIIEICKLYLSNYGDYKDNLLNSKMGLIDSMIGLASLSAIFFAYLTFYAKNEQMLLSKIVKMYHKTRK